MGGDLSIGGEKLRNKWLLSWGHLIKIAEGVFLSWKELKKEISLKP